MEKIIFFDWDGTLCSTRVSEQANVKRTQFFNSQLTEKELIKLQHNNNNNHYKLIQEIISSKLGVEIPEVTKTIQAILFGNFYIQEFRKEDLLFNVEEFKKFKEKNNLKFVIATSLWEGAIKASLKKANIENLFDGVYACPPDLSTNKLQNLERAIKNTPGTPLVMIGDRGEDINAGKEFNLSTIFCNYGHGQIENATYCIESPKELLGVTKKLI